LCRLGSVIHPLQQSAKNGMPDQIEIMLQEIAILRGEVAYLHTVLEKSDESLRNLSVTLFERLNTLVDLVQKLEARLPSLPQ
jgi:hypothetical protein